MKIINNICCIFNLAAHYRAPINKLMDRHLNCDFYITTWKISPFKQMNYNELKGLKKTSNNVSLFGNFYWQKGIMFLAFKNYEHYIMTAEPYALATWPLLLILKIIGKKSYIWTHGWYGDESFIKRKIKKLFFTLPHKILLYGDYARNLMIKEGFPPSKLICIYNSLDYDYQIKVREKLTPTNIYKSYFKNNFPVLLFIGRIQKSKKIELLIEAIKILENEGIKCNLVIIGSEFEKTKISEEISAYYLDEHVWKYGDCYDEDKIGELIFNATICVSPGNVGLNAIHSLMYGTPVITHGNFKNQGPEFEAIKQGENGDFFHEDSAIDLTIKIKKWLKLTKEKKEHIRKQCHKVIDERYNPNIQIKILLNTIE